MDVRHKEIDLDSSQSFGLHDLKLPPSESETETSVHCWSVGDVVSWLQKHVPLESERIQDCSRSFQNEGIDGLRLLALRRNSYACSVMSDSEWLLFYAARESLLVTYVPTESHPNSPFLFPKSTEENILEDGSPKLHEPFRLHSSKSLTLGPPQRKSGLLKSSLSFLSFPSWNWWTSLSTKHKQKESVAAEVSSLHEEIQSAEGRETVLKAKVDHMDEILRTAQLASYLYTRMRWTPLPGELPVDDVDVDDWLQRFLVLAGSALFYYPQAADLRPQGAILFSEIVDVGAISGKIQHDGESLTWFGFHITTCDGLRFECATSIKLQADLWMSLIQATCTDQQTPSGR